MRFKTEDIQFSPIKAIQAEVERCGAVSLAQGIPKFLPPLEVRRATAVAIERGLVDFYGPPRGLPELCKKEVRNELGLELKEEIGYVGFD